MLIGRFNSDEASIQKPDTKDWIIEIKTPEYRATSTSLGALAYMSTSSEETGYLRMQKERRIPAVHYRFHYISDDTRKEPAQARNYNACASAEEYLLMLHGQSVFL